MLRRGVLGRLESALQAQQKGQGQEAASGTTSVGDSNGLPNLNEVLMKLQSGNGGTTDSPVPPAEPIATPVPGNQTGAPSTGISPESPASALLQGLESLLPTGTCAECRILLVRFQGVANFLLIICDGEIVAIAISDISFNLLVSIGVPYVEIPVISCL